jgi:outer membrane autotransporter protein
MKNKEIPRTPRAKALSIAIATALAAMSPLMARAQTVDNSQAGPIFATSGTDIIVTGAGTITGGQGVIADPGVSIGTLSNSGSISGYAIGVNNAGSIGALLNNGMTNVSGLSGSHTGVLNTGTIGTLTNSGSLIVGIAGVYGYSAVGILNVGGTITSLTNSGDIEVTASNGFTANGVENSGTIDTLTNSGTVTIASTSGGSANGIRNFGSIGTVTNSGTISASAPGDFAYGIGNSGTIGTLSNSGTISASASGGIAFGIVNDSTIGTLTNSDTGLVSGSNVGIQNYNTISTLNNSGAISGGFTGANNASGAGIGTLTNSGTISANANGSAAYGIQNLGTIDTLTNNGSGTIIATGASNSHYGIHNAGAIGALTNNGSIIAGANSANEYLAAGISNDSGTITNLTNGGQITAMADNTHVAYGIWNNGGTIGTLTNSGTISASGGLANAIENDGTIGALINDAGATIGGGSAGVVNGDAGTINTLTNNGTITGAGAGAGGSSQDGVSNSGTIGTLTNSGLITGVLNSVFNSGTIDTLTNSGRISGANGTGGGVGIQNSGTIGVLSNSGSISGGSVGINTWGTIGTLTNNGTITGGQSGVLNTDTIGALTNNGFIHGDNTGVDNWWGTIGTLTNSGMIQGEVNGLADMNGSIGTLNNSGLINGGVNGLAEGGTIDVLNNTGTISGYLVGLYNGIAAPAPIGTLDNSGEIFGGKTAIYNGNGDSIGTVINSGLIFGGGNALYNAADGTLGSIVNSGTIVGNIANLSTGDLDINGGTGTIFGTLTGLGGSVGVIANTASNVVFGSGNLLLNDNIYVGGNSVNNTGATLQVNAPVTIAGNYSQGASATLLSGVSSATSYGQLVVTGNATIAAGSSVGLTSQSYAFAAGQRYLVVDAAGTGSYNADSLNYSATGYSGTVIGQVVTVNGHSDLELCLQTCSAPTPPTPPTGPATVPNSVASLGGLSNYTGLNPGLTNLQNAVIASNTNGSTAEANRVGAQLAPTRPGAGAQAAAVSTFDVLSVVAAHANSLRLAQADGDGSTQSGVATGEAAPQWGVWGQAFGGHAGQGAVDQVDGYSANYAGLLVGADRAVSDHWRAGGVFSYSNTLVDNTENSAGDSTRVNGYGLIGYASYTGTPWYVNLSGGVVQQHYNTTRQIDITGFSGVANGQFSGQQYVASVEGGWPLAIAGLTLTPLASLTYSYQHENAYTESGGNGAALAVDATHSTSVRSALGAKLERGFDTACGTIVPDLQVKWIHEYDHARSTTGASFAADPTGQSAFTNVGPVPVSDLADVSLGVTVIRANNLTLTARYELQAAPRFVSQTGTLRLRQLF